jgi:hypothetical protein
MTARAEDVGGRVPVRRTRDCICHDACHGRRRSGVCLGCERQGAPRCRFTACRVLPDAVISDPSLLAHAYVPFCAAVRMAMAVILARCSAPTRVRSATPRYRRPSAVVYALQSGQAASVLAPVAAPRTTHRERRQSPAAIDHSSCLGSGLVSMKLRPVQVHVSVVKTFGQHREASFTYPATFSSMRLVVAVRNGPSGCRAPGTQESAESRSVCSRCTVSDDVVLL